MYKASQKAEWDEYARIMTATEIGEKAGLQKGEALGLQKGEALGLQKGEALGLQKGRIEIAKTMLSKGMDLNSIAEITGLSKEEIKHL